MQQTTPPKDDEVCRLGSQIPEFISLNITHSITPSHTVALSDSIALTILRRRNLLARTIPSCRILP